MGWKGFFAGGPLGYILEEAIGSLSSSLVDNVFKDKVTPIEGSIVHCSLYGVEHTGIYIDNESIIELLGTGEIRSTNPASFIDGTNSISIYVACDDTRPIGSKIVANRASAYIGKSRDYHLLYDNCHQFTGGCVTGNFSDGKTIFWMLEDSISKHLNNGRSITWRVWNRV